MNLPHLHQAFQTKQLNPESNPSTSFNAKLRQTIKAKPLK
jgi:hypothetical protein